MVPKSIAVVLLSLFLFILVFSGINFALRPSFLFLPDGSYRAFGIGYQKKTIFPGWFVSMLCAILCYLLARTIITAMH